MTDVCRQNVVFFYVMQQRNIKTKLQFNHKNFVNAIRGPILLVLDRVRHFRPIHIHRFFAVNRIRYRYDTDFFIRFKSGRGAA